MLVSVIIPIYKVEKYIERCVQSVAEQTFTDYEIILVDDASPDTSLQIAESILRKKNIAFQSIIHQQNKGQSVARNTGLKIAKGNYIMFVDSDDFLANPKVLSTFYDIMQQGNYDFVEANYNHIQSNTIKKQTYIEGFSKDEKLSGNAILEALLYTRLSVSPCSKLINKAFLLKNELFFFKGIVYEDELWAFKMCIAAEKCYYIAQSYYNYNVSNPDSTVKNVSAKTVADKFFIIKEQIKIIDENGYCTAKNAAAFVYSFRRLSVQLIRSLVLLGDAKGLRAYYKKLLNVYNTSSLRIYRNGFFFSTNFMFWVFEKRLTSKTLLGKAIFDFLIAYNGIGLKTLWQKLKQRMR